MNEETQFHNATHSTEPKRCRAVVETRQPSSSSRGHERSTLLCPSTTLTHCTNLLTVK